AAVLGAPFADMQPAAVIELRFEGARSLRLKMVVLQPRADLGHAADLNHGLIGGTRNDRGVRQLVQPLEMRVAEHQPIARVPEHESLRDRLDRVAQSQIGLDGSLRKAFLFGNVDGDAYQVHARVVGTMAELATDTKPDPVSAAVLHPESLID